MRAFYLLKRKNQFDYLLVLGNNHHLLPLLQLGHPSRSGCLDVETDIVSDCENCCRPINGRATVEGGEVVGIGVD